ncbi:MAG: flagellar M-ring protein FliF [Cellvibrionaceae bacterium]|nr:flagellar M-ring protein FliF [Cellvibrionaceae bacterium]
MSEADIALEPEDTVKKDRSTNDLVEGFNNLNLLRQIGLMVALASSVAIGFAVVLWTQGEDYRPLYAGLDRLDSKEVIEILETSHIDFKVDTRSGALLVAADQIHDARIKLAELGLPSDASVGFELLDQEQPLGTSHFMENARYRRSLEGELARTITSINSVRSSRVHLAIPKTSVFVRDAREPRASVFVELYAGRGIKNQQVRAIANLVASSISELKLKNVTVVDQKGNLLSTGDDDPNIIKAMQELEYSRQIEENIVARVHSLLDPIVGSNRYRAEVAADVDFNEVEQAEEMFNPDLPAVRSEQTLDEQRLGNAAGGIPGALANQPPADGAAPEQAANDEGGGGQPSNTRKQATRNFELDRSVSYIKHQVGKVRRLSVAVVVDDKEVIDPASGAVSFTTWTDNELERLAILIRDAVGFSAVRGDSVNVINTPFVGGEDFGAGEGQLAFWEQAWLRELVKPFVGLLIVFVIFSGLLRPILKTLARTGVQVKEDEEAKQLAALEAAGLGSFDELSDETVTLSGGEALSLPGPEESYEQMLNTIKGLIAEDPGRVSQVIKRWINEE